MDSLLSTFYIEMVRKERIIQFLSVVGTAGIDDLIACCLFAIQVETRLANPFCSVYNVLSLLLFHFVFFCFDTCIVNNVFVFW